MLLGLAAGDALGVPVEFCSRTEVQADPVVSMRGYGTHQQPPGTWSDDASLTFCLADALTTGDEAGLTGRLATNMVGWRYENRWTPHGTVFDIGIGTAQAIGRLRQGVLPERAGGSDEYSNGNGSLMRIAPAVLLLTGKPVDERFDWAQGLSAPTHRHVRSVMACFYYLELMRFIGQGYGKTEAYAETNRLAGDYWSGRPDTTAELPAFDRLLGGTLADAPEQTIESSGYVLHTLEAAIWCWLTTDTYTDAVLKAVNLGSDTDTTGAVTGALAGFGYGVEAIPADWIETLASLPMIWSLIAQLNRWQPH
ncbi:ADP-ribosylglycohydrolase family protein [Spirosoma luteolum]